MSEKEIKNSFLRLCDIILNFNSMGEYLEDMGITLNPDFLKGDFYGTISLVVEEILQFLHYKTETEKEQLRDELLSLNRDNYSEITEKLWKKRRK